ncbi:MAG: hypothetical protein RIS72_944, partial [Pseudomonadota bacterium]
MQVSQGVQQQAFASALGVRLLWANTAL